MSTPTISYMIVPTVITDAMLVSCTVAEPASGETEWNAEQRLQGQDNSLLSERGVAQVKRFRAYAKALQPARIVASDLGRTRQTVALIGHPDAPRQL